MKKIVFLMFALFMTVTANAQFEADKVYVGASLSGIDFHYNGNDKLNLGVDGMVGYLPMDNLMLLGSASFKHNGDDDVPDEYKIGAGGRYYITQNGLYLGANAKFVHASHDYNDIMPGVEIGYAFFVNRTVTIEPAVYYDQSFKRSKYSTVGLKIGIGLYLFGK
jgi:hypothetical protein